VCAGGAATLLATTSSTNASYLWSDSETTASITVSPGSTATYTVTVTDGVTGCANSGGGTVTVNPLPVITTSSLPDATYHAAYNQTVGGTGVATFSAVGLPPGLSLDSGGNLAGTPLVAGTSNVVITATSAAGCVTSAALSLTVGKAASAVGLVSSENPSGYHDSVQFAATGLAADAGGSVAFLTNGSVLSLSNLVGGTAGSLAISSLPRGNNTVTVEYAGDANYLGSTNSLTQTVTNHPPVAVAATYYRAKGMNLKISISDLLTNVTDVDGDAGSLQGVGASGTGATILTNGVCIFYIPGTGANSNANDSFTYTVSDGFGGSATANLLVDVYSAAGPAQIALPSNGVVNLTFYGISNYTYVVQTTTNLSVPWWTLGTNTAGTNGMWRFTDPNATNAQQYYRSAQP